MSKVTTFESRAREFLNYVVANDDNRRLTMWGPYRCFDGYALAHLALGRRLGRGRELIRETLEMMRGNFLVELARSEDKWHLADFAVHPLLRACLLYRRRYRGREWKEVWADFERVLSEFILHRDDLTENHNLLHHALRYLVGQEFPRLPLRDGRPAAKHVPEARSEILKWVRSWVTQGSVEWGADLYCNVNLLSLLNLVDFAKEPLVRNAARGVVDLMMLDQAVGGFAGALVTAARRGYSCYRMETSLSPARPLQYLEFGRAPELGRGSFFNLNFIGGVIVAATSQYRVPAAIAGLAHDRTPTVTGTTHTVPAWDQDHVGQTTFRCGGAMLSAQNCAPGPRDYCADHVWQATLGEKAVVFGNVPTAFQKDWQWYRGSFTAETVLAGFERGVRGDLHPLWVPGNMPPGHAGDIRPGYWQGHPHSPRSFGAGRAAFIIYNLPPDSPLPWTHLYFPRRAFDEVRSDGHWTFARKGHGYVGVWTSVPGVWTTSGTWADVEVRIQAPRNGTFVLVGDRSLDGSFAGFMDRAAGIDPRWDESAVSLSAMLPGENELLVVNHASGASRGGVPVTTRGPRVQTPWGSLPLGALELSLATPHGDYHLDLNNCGLRSADCGM